MRYPSLILTMMLLSSAALLAQTGAHGTNAILTAGPASESCPVGFSASRTAAPTLTVAKRSKQNLPSLGLQLNFARLDASKIVKANITVHGASGKGHLMQAGTTTDSETTETFELHSNAGLERLFHSEISLKKMSAVSWVDLTEIEYADGSVWRASADSKCRAVPNSLLLVADAQ
jgi:hypothetical protein